MINRSRVNFCLNLRNHSLSHSLFHGILLSLMLNGCSAQSLALNTTNIHSVRSTSVAQASQTGRSNAALLWSSDFSEDNWKEHWNVLRRGAWGWQNAQIIADESGQFNKVLHIRYPKGSASPTVTREQRAPVGGAQFYADLDIGSQTALKLSYSVRFSEEFDFVKGGKLPGLFGGLGNNGGRIPDGRDGFSTRYMWRRGGQGEVYAYLPSSQEHGTSIGRGQWRFQPGRWYHLEQEVQLNHPGQKDGRVRVWVDGRLRLDKDQLEFRSTDALKIDGILFSTFFGGNDSSWATKKDVSADFADFAVYAVE